MRRHIVQTILSLNTLSSGMQVESHLFSAYLLSSPHAQVNRLYTVGITESSLEIESALTDLILSALISIEPFAIDFNALWRMLLTLNLLNCA